MSDPQSLPRTVDAAYCTVDPSVPLEPGDRRGEVFTSWNLGLLYEGSDPARAVDLMQVCVDYECKIGHPDAEPHAARVEEIWARVRTADRQD